MSLPPSLYRHVGTPETLLAAIRTEQRRQCLVRATRRRLESGLRVHVYPMPAPRPGFFPTA